MNSDIPDPSRSARPSPLWLVLVLGIVVVGVTFYRSRMSERAPDAGSSTNAATQAGAPAEAARPRIVGAGPAPESPEQMQQQTLKNKLAIQAEVDTTYSGYKTQYDSEAVDPAWSGAKEQDLLKLSTTPEITRLNANISNLQVDCKSRMCRLTGDFPTLTAGNDWFTLYSLNVGDGIPTSTFKYERNDDGTYKIVIYAVGRK